MLKKMLKRGAEEEPHYIMWLTVAALLFLIAWVIISRVLEHATG